MQLFEASWRRSGFGDSNDDLQFREKAVAALTRYWELDQKRAGKPVWFERGFSFKLGPHLVRGRVDRVDELPDGSFELIDYKTGRPKSEDDLRDDVQLSLYQLGGARVVGGRGASGSYYYVLDNEKVPVAHSDDELARVQGDRRGDRRRHPRAGVRAEAELRALLVLRLPDHLPGGREVERRRRLRRRTLSQARQGPALALQVALEVARDRVG